MALRSYQEQAIESVLTDWREGHQAVLLHMATGTGKTQVYLGLVDRVLREEPDARAMVIAHTMELVEQPVDRLRQFWPDLGRKAGIVMAERNDAAAQIISATVQTISNPARFAAAVAAGPIKYLVTDEAHHAVASTYRKVYEMMDRYCPGWKHVGVTATPMRSDGEALAQVFGKLSYQYTIKDGVVEKWLGPPRWLAIKTGISLAGVPTSRSGDYVGKRLADVFETDNCFDLVVESHQKFGGGRKAIAFVQTVAGAYRLAEVFNAAGIAAEAADGKTPKDERAAVLKRFRRGETRVLVNCALYTEGVDVPDVELIHQVRPTKSNSLYCLDAKTEVLTPGGWRKHDEVRAGDLVAAFDSRSERIEWQPALAKVDRPMYAGEKMYALSTPSVDVRVTGDHRMVYQNMNRNAKWLICTADDLSRRRNMYRLPVAGYQDAPGVPLSDAEISLIGWYITDGTINAKNGQMMIAQSEHQTEHVAHIHETLKGCGLKYRVHRFEYPDGHAFKATGASLRFCISRGKPRGQDKHLSGWGHLSGYLDKSLSPLLDDMTEAQLGVLLNAMHLGDGAKQNGQAWTRRSYHIATANQTLCDRLQSLCVRRGWRCNVAEHKNPNGRPIYYLHIKKGISRVVGGLSDHRRDGRGAITESPVADGERVWCLETELGTLVTRRNGKVAIVGNCQMIGRGLRPVPGKSDCLILDYAPAEWRDIVMLGDVLGLNKAVVEATKQVEVPDDEVELVDDDVLAGFTYDGEAKGLLGDPLELVSRALNYLEMSPWSWHHGNDGWMTVGLGSDYKGTERILAIEPPDEDGNCRLWKIGRRAGERYWQAQLGESGEFEAISAVAEEIISRYSTPILAEKKRRWRADPPTQGQVNWGRAMGIKGIESMSKGQASDAITHALALRAISRALR